MKIEIVNVYGYTVTIPSITHRKITREMIEKCRKIRDVYQVDDNIGILRVIFKHEVITYEDMKAILRTINGQDSQREA